MLSSTRGLARMITSSPNKGFALGKTDRGRLLFVVFTIRGDKIRVISARDASKKERSHYQ
jgi:uncharacterized DUF497 family protein